MMKQAILIPAAVCLFLVGCAQKDATVKGTLTNADGETVTLQRLTATEVIPVDSMTVGTDGDFKLSTGELIEPGFYRLMVNPNNFVILLLEQGENAKVKGSVLDFYKSYEVEGSENSRKLLELDKRMRKDFDKTDSLKRVYQKFYQEMHPNLDSIAKSIDSSFKEMQAVKREFIVKFIAENENTLLALSAVHSLNPAEDLETYEKVSANLSELLPESDYVKQFNKQVADIKSKQQATKRTEVGAEAPEIVLETPDGKTIKLSDFRGKVTMIDFWASWCKPCRMENPTVVKVYNRYKSKGFDIFGVSLDQSKEKWVEAIKQDGLAWKHGSELKGWSSSFLPAYDLTGIPMTYLLDEDGKIIAKGLRGEDLEKSLMEIFE